MADINSILFEKGEKCRIFGPREVFGYGETPEGDKITLWTRITQKIFPVIAMQNILNLSN